MYVCVKKWGRGEGRVGNDGYTTHDARRQKYRNIQYIYLECEGYQKKHMLDRAIVYAAEQTITELPLIEPLHED